MQRKIAAKNLNENENEIENKNKNLSLFISFFSSFSA